MKRIKCLLILSAFSLLCSHFIMGQTEKDLSNTKKVKYKVYRVFDANYNWQFYKDDNAVAGYYATQIISSHCSI